MTLTVRFRAFAFLVLLFLFLISCGTTSHRQNQRERTPSAESESPFRIVGYYSIGAALQADIKTVPFNQLTHINLWFLNPDFLGNYKQDLSGLSGFVEEAHKQNVSVLFSIGGGGHYQHYSHLLTDRYRSSLIHNLLDEVLKYNLDGVDVDLESSAIDENYEVFVTELGTELRKHHKMMTSAIAVYYKDQLTDNALAQYDFMNVMVYDRTGPWNPEKPGPHSTYQNAVDDLEYFTSERNIPKEKLVLGVPFYGYAFSTIPENPPKSMNYGEITANYPGSEWVDEWEIPGNYTIYYNGIPTIMEKTVLAKEKASGIMIWQILGDATNEKSLLKTINKVADSY